MKKKCSVCGILKNENTDFYPVDNRLGKTYRRNVCKSCFNLEPKAKHRIPSRRLLTAEQIHDIQSRYLDHETLRSIAESVGVSKSSVSKYVWGLHRNKSIKPPRRPVKSSIKNSIKNSIDRPVFVLREKKVPAPKIKHPDYSDYTLKLQVLVKHKDRYVA